ncbi:hypothetical protein ACSAZL_01140 [Methanosarcina sp. T3]|uniref:hypothetical protein n=1 Tax=Methanosarcina sp. T3 TaxID=3439062 RepID=UPI003F87FE44
MNPCLSIRQILQPVILPSLIGALFVAAGDAQAANLIWSVSNPLLVWHNCRTRDYSQAFLFFVFWIIAFAGMLLQVGVI